MIKKTYRPHEQAILTQRVIVGAALILMIAGVAVSNRDKFSSVDAKNAISKIISFKF